MNVVPAQADAALHSVPRLAAARRRIPADGWAVAAVTLTVLLANLPYLVGAFDPNPLGPRSGLASSVVPGLINGKPTIDPNIGYSSQAIGHLAALDLLHLHLPWWNPYEATGMPLVGETQGAALFPPTLLTALSNGQLYEHMLLELIAGICTYLLLRRLLVTRWAAAAGAIAFALNGTFAWFAHAAVNPVPFLPMLLLGIERALAATHADERGGWRLLALAVALSLYAGFPEVAYIDALMGVVWIAWRCGALGRRQVATFVTKAALGAVAGVLLAAPLLLAISGDLSHADVGVHTGVQLGAEHLPANALPQLLMPYLYGQINSDPNAVIWTMVGGFLSTSLLVLALLGLFAGGRRSLSLVLLGWGILLFARMYGQPPLLGHVLGVLPDMSRIAFFRYGTPVLELTVIVLAALGLDDLARVPEHRRRLVWGALAAMAVVLGAVLGALPRIHTLGAGFHHRPYVDASIAWGALVPALAAAVALVRIPRARVVALTVLVAVDSLVLFVLPELAAPRAVTIDQRPVAYLRRHLGDARFFTLGPIQPNYSSYFALASLDINDFPPQAYANYVHARLDPVVNPTLFIGTFGGWRPVGQPGPERELMRHLSGYRAAGVRYVLSPTGYPLPQSSRTFRLVFRSSTTLIYRLAGAQSYFTAPGCRISSSSRQSALVSCPRPATLVRRETWLQGWSAQLDGHPIAIRRIGGLFQAVSMPAGEHRISFSFAPPGIDWALLGLLGACALMCAPAIAYVKPLAARARATALHAGA
jgi:hypothetical protein